MPKMIRARLAAPILPVCGEKESLRGQGRLAAQGLIVPRQVCRVGDSEPAEVSDVFGQRVAPLDVLARDFKLVIEPPDAMRARLKPFA